MNRCTFTPEQLAAKPGLLARNPQLAGEPVHVPASNEEKLTLPYIQGAIIRRPSKDERGLNRTESAYLAHLRARTGHDWVGIQCFTLKLADDVRYTPDFWTVERGALIAHEVKGFFRDDARVKLRVAARMYPFITFMLVRRDKREWKIEEVAP